MDSQINLGRTISAVIFNVRHIRYSIKNSVVNKRFDIGMLLQLKGPTFSLKKPVSTFFYSITYVRCHKTKITVIKILPVPINKVLQD